MAQDGSERGSWGREDWQFLAFILLAFLVSRVLWIAFSPAATTYWEESYRWLAAHELLTQPTRSLLDYQADHYQGGSLIVILLTVPFFALLGESLLSFKLSALLISCVTLATLYALNRDYFGARSARLAGLAYLLGPPLVAFWGVVPMGFHGDSSALSLLQIYLYLGLVTGRFGAPGGWLLFGFVCGAGISFTYITALSAAACVATWMIVRPPPAARALAYAALGGFLGLLPWLAYNVTHAFAGVGRVRQLFLSEEATVDAWAGQGLGEKLLDLVVEMPTQGLLDPSGEGIPFGLGAIVACGVLVPVGLALLDGFGRMLCLLRRGVRASAPSEAGEQRELVFFVYLLIFVFVYLMSPFDLAGETHMILYRLFPPLAVVFITPIAITAAKRMHGAAPARHLALAAVVTAMTANAAATLAFALRPVEPSGVSLEHGYRIAGQLAHRKYASLPSAIDTVPYSEPETRALALWGIGCEIQHRFEIAGELTDVEARVRSIPAADRLPILEGMLWAAEARLETLSAAEDPDERRRRMLDRIDALLELAETEILQCEAPEAAPE